MTNRKEPNLGDLFSAIQHSKYQDIENIIESNTQLLVTLSSSGIYAWQKVAEAEKNLSQKNGGYIYLIECTLKKFLSDVKKDSKNQNHYGKIVEFLCDETIVEIYLKQLVCELTLEEKGRGKTLIMKDGKITLSIFELPDQQGRVSLSYVFSDLGKKYQLNSLKDFLQNEDNRSILLAALKKQLEPKVAAPADEVLAASNHSYTSVPAPAPLPESAPVSWRTRLEQTFFACTPCAQR